MEENYKFKAMQYAQYIECMPRILQSNLAKEVILIGANNNSNFFKRISWHLINLLAVVVFGETTR